MSRHLGDDGRGLGGYGRATPVSRPFRIVALFWHPSLFVFAVYLIVLSSIVLAFDAR